MSRPADPHAKIALLRACESVFAEHGLAAAKVEEITRRAGLSKGAFYLHFESKDEAFKHVVESFLARVGAINPPPGDTSELPETAEQLVAFWLERDAQLFEFLWQNRAIVAILAGCQGEYAYLCESFSESCRAGSRQWIEVFKAQDLIRPELDSELVVTLLFGAYNELSRQMLTLQRKPAIFAWLRQTLSIFLRGLGTPALLSALRSAEAEDAPVSQPMEQRQESRGSKRAVRARS